nr:tyrosine-type recombinase/integrase [Nonomuraea basaltis]
MPEHQRAATRRQVDSLRLHTTRHLCLTDLARMGWELHAISTFAGHRSTESTMRYIHLSGRDLADKLNRTMEHIHAWRIEALTRMNTVGDGGIK